MLDTKQSKDRRRRIRIVESSSSRESSPSPNNQPDTETPNEVPVSVFDAEVFSSELPRATVEATQEKALDDTVLQILGNDPTATVEYGKEVHKELANRFEHIATTGLTKEIRKELCEKYLVPSNCVHIGAPKLNAEIKAALNETLVKRNKAAKAVSKSGTELKVDSKNNRPTCHEEFKLEVAGPSSQAGGATAQPEACHSAQPSASHTHTSS
ncbi:uncharacterized protein LOC128200270 [Galleria mellonella]|uniref:Uncharacterized protein LOC128200270 n=1 Tax=Galleria mellonella TaxID=7137 RepID=A0ABM3MD55_GALME|nr:uncharacterized protein LOC128200270 [Galleria mellonella]